MSNGSWSNTDVSRVVIVEGGVYTGLFFYAPSIGAGNLVGSWTAQAGTDPYGNAYPAGLNVQSALSQVTLNAVNNIITETFITGNASVSASAFIQANVAGTGTGEIDTWLLESAQNNTNRDTAGILLQSNNTADTLPARVIVFYMVPGNQIDYLTVGDGGVTITAGTIGAVMPGSGTSPLNVAVPETWNLATLGSGWGNVTGLPRLQYRVTPTGDLQIMGCVQSTSATPASTVFTLPAAWSPAANTRVGGVVERNAAGDIAHSIAVNTTGAVILLNNLTAANIGLYWSVEISLNPA